MAAKNSIIFTISRENPTASIGIYRLKLVLGELGLNHFPNHKSKTLAPILTNKASFYPKLKR